MRHSQKTVIFANKILLLCITILFLFLACTPQQLSRNDKAKGIEKLDMPFGINDAVDSAKDKSDYYLKDLRVVWISDHLPRRAIEKAKKGTEDTDCLNIDYDFSKIEDKIKEYGKDINSHAWFVINIESKYKCEDGKRIEWQKSEGKFIPYGPESYKAYERFLTALTQHINSQVPNWKVKLWSIDNEHTTLFIPAFCKEKEVNPECAKHAAKAYADLVEFSYNTIKKLDSEAKIVFGGPSSATSDEEYNWYYKEALNALKNKHQSGYFDFFDYHNFALYEQYMTNSRNKDVDFFRKLLADAGFGDKPIIIKAGATHSGKDIISKNKRLHNLQTESQQAEYLVKRAVYHVVEGVQLILWGTIREDEDDHETFTYNGLVYNGRPIPCDKQQIVPCPDPGDGLKKLSYYAYKLLIEKLQSSDFENVKTIDTGIPNIYLYEFTKQNKPIYVAWWNYFEESGKEKKLALVLPNLKANKVKITEAIPYFNEDFQTTTKKLKEEDYPNFFKSYISPLGLDRTININFDNKPLYIEPLY